MELIAKRNMTYAARRLSPGDRFSAPASDARVLIAIQKAEIFVKTVAAADGPAESQKTENSMRPRKRRTMEGDEQNGILET